MSFGAGSLYHHARKLLTCELVDSPQRNRHVLIGTGRQALVMAWPLAQVTRPGAPPDPDFATAL